MADEMLPTWNAYNTLSANVIAVYRLRHSGALIFIPVVKKHRLLQASRDFQVKPAFK